MGYRAKPPRPKPDFIVDRRGRTRSAPAKPARKRLWHVFGAGAALAIAAPTGSLGESVRTLSLSAAASARDIIAARSPGKRTRAEMGKGKFVRATPKPVTRPVVRRPLVVARPPAPVPRLLVPPPQQLPLVFADRPFEPGPPDFASLAPGPIGADQACLCNYPLLERPAGGGFVALLGPGGGGGGGFVPPPPGGGGGGVVLPPPGGGGGGVVPPGPGPGGGGGVLPPPAAIPEPDTWGMMILGFAALGTVWRRRRVLVKLIVDTGLLRLEYRPVPVTERFGVRRVH